MEFKVIISDPESGKSYQREIKDEKAARLRNLKMGDEFDGSAVGLTGYTLKITGGSDKSGFPMKKGVHGVSRPRILMVGGVGYKARTDTRKRKRVRGEKIDEDIVQINTRVIKRAKKDIEELLGLSVEKEKPEEKVVEKEANKKVEVKEGVLKEKPEEEEPQAKKSKEKKSKEEKSG